MFFRSDSGHPRAANGLWLAYSATIALIFVLCVVVVGHDLLRTWEDRASQLENTRREVANLSLAADKHAEDGLRLADTTLSGLIERVETDGTGPAQIERLRRVMAQRAGATGILSTLALIDATGAVLVTAEPTTPSMNIVDRPVLPISPRPSRSWALHQRHPARENDGKMGDRPVAARGPR